MPREYGGQKVNLQKVGTPHPVNLPDADFGVGAGRALKNVSQSLQNYYQKSSAATARDALNRFRDQRNRILFDPDNGYYNTQGRNAYDSADSTVQSIIYAKESLAGEIHSSLAERQFHNAADHLVDRATKNIQEHASKG